MVKDPLGQRVTYIQFRDCPVRVCEVSFVLALPLRERLPMVLGLRRFPPPADVTGCQRTSVTSNSGQKNECFAALRVCPPYKQLPMAKGDGASVAIMDPIHYGGARGRT